MLDNTDNQQFHERIVEVAPFLPGIAAEAFPESKLQRILERVYHRIADDEPQGDDAQLRQLLAQVQAHFSPDPAPLSESKTQRILARVQARLDAEAAAAKPAARKASPLAGLRSAAALFLLRQLIFDPRGARPLPDGPAE
jgi:hypothetical protein